MQTVILIESVVIHHYMTTLSGHLTYGTLDIVQPIRSNGSTGSATLDLTDLAHQEA